MKGHFYISNKIMDDGYLKKMSGNDLKVLIAIARHYNKYGKCFPSIRRMTEYLNLHHETIGNCLKNLKKMGFIEILEIKERCKLRYIFSNSARFLFSKPNNVVEKSDSKELKDINKEKELNNLTHKERTPEEQERINQNLAEIRRSLANKLCWVKK